MYSLIFSNLPNINYCHLRFVLVLLFQHIMKHCIRSTIGTWALVVGQSLQCPDETCDGSRVTENTETVWRLNVWKHFGELHSVIHEQCRGPFVHQVLNQNCLIYQKQFF
jgi:hypothetical protein